MMLHMKKTIPLSAEEQLIIAGKAAVDPRTVARYLRGEPIRTRGAERIRRALEELNRAA